MKSFFFTVLLVWAIGSTSCIAQSVSRWECLYRFTMDRDTVKHQPMEDLMVLRTDGKRSIFFSREARERDSLLNSPEGEALGQAMLAGVASRGNSRACQYSVLKDEEKKQLDFTDDVGGDRLTYTEQLPSFAWQMIPGDSIIMNKHCQCAVTSFRGRRYVAWFCPDIAINDGPWKFYGLPGLILEIHDIKRQYVFEFLGMSEQKSPIAFLSENYARTTLADYLKTLRRYLNDPVGYIMASSGIDVMPVSSQGKIKRRSASYAPMELCVE